MDRLAWRQDAKRTKTAKPLAPLERLLDRSQGRAVRLPPALSRVYGSLRFPLSPTRPYVVGNFATTLDGVVSLGTPGASSGGEITGFDFHDRLLMGILRSVADAVIVGAGTLRAVPRQIWTAEHVYPPLAAEFRLLRRRLGKPASPLNVVVTESGRLDLTLPLFSARGVPVLIVTTTAGARRLGSTTNHPSVRVRTVRPSGPVSAVDVIRAVRGRTRPGMLLVEGGPHLIGSFFAERHLDELFLTLVPQVAGRGGMERPGLVAGRTFAPEHPVWGSLVGIRRAKSLLFLRFAFDAKARPPRRPTSPNS